jgi:hypothetical protein
LKIHEKNFPVMSVRIKIEKPNTVGPRFADDVSEGDQKVEVGLNRSTFECSFRKFIFFCETRILKNERCLFLFSGRIISDVFDSPQSLNKAFLCLNA